VSLVEVADRLAVDWLSALTPGSGLLQEKRALKEQEKRQRAEQRDTYQKLSGKDALASCCVQIDPSLIGKDRLGSECRTALPRQPC
jgi:hypothetical protein